MNHRPKQKQPAAESVPVTIIDPERYTGRLKGVGGSQSDDWNDILANDAIRALWFFKNSDEKTKNEQIRAALSGLIGIAPRDELEGMMAAQLIAAHSAAMECYRRAMIGEQTFDGRRECLNQANRLSRSFTQLLDALNRHRGKGQQKVTVEHVHVHSGGQAVVGVVESSTKDARSTPPEHTNAKQIANAPEPAMWSTNADRQPVPVAFDEERPLSDARRNLAGRPEGK
jgi:hypothetical protein